MREKRQRLPLRELWKELARARERVYKLGRVQDAADAMRDEYVAVWRSANGAPVDLVPPTVGEYDAVRKGEG